MGETYISVDVPVLAARAVSMRNHGNDLHDLGMAIAGLSVCLSGSPVPPVASSSSVITVACGSDAVAAARAAERAHRSALAEIHVRLVQVANGMAQAADTYARHEAGETRVILAAA